MSEQINNREYRKTVLKDIIKQLHDGKSVDEVKQSFAEVFDGVSAMEISDAEQALIAEGMPVGEVQRLCDVHSAVFKGSIEEIHARPIDQSRLPGHPIYMLKKENRHIEKIIDNEILPNLTKLHQADAIDAVRSGLAALGKIDIHYSRKENLLFPYLEKYGITAPPKVMWGVDDEIRAQLKEVTALAAGAATGLAEKLSLTVERIKEMIYKEDNILIPMLHDTLTQDEWSKIADDSGEIGFMLDKVPVWTAAGSRTPSVEKSAPGIISLPSGEFKTEELINMLNTLPFDITFVDKDDVVKYFSQSKERIFPRTKSIIGRNVSNCHPPASVHVVEKIVEDFKSGAKDHEDFWIKGNGVYIYIRYFAVRGANNEYLGVVEVTQNIQPVQQISGEKRLLSE